MSAKWSVCILTVGYTLLGNANVVYHAMLMQLHPLNKVMSYLGCGEIRAYLRATRGPSTGQPLDSLASTICICADLGVVMYGRAI